MKNILLQNEINARINLRGQREKTGFFKIVDRQYWNSKRQIHFEIQVLRTLKNYPY